MPIYQDWVAVAEQIDCPAPLPEDTSSAFLLEMLSPAPYEVPKKKAKKAVMTHKCRGSIIVLSISKSVKPNEEQKEMTSGFQQDIVCKC